MENIAHNAYMSQAYLIRLFKEETGETPNSYLIRTRIGKARKLLENGDKSVDEIARLVGL